MSVGACFMQIHFLSYSLSLFFIQIFWRKKKCFLRKFFHLHSFTLCFSLTLVFLNVWMNDNSFSFFLPFMWNLHAINVLLNKGYCSSHELNDGKKMGTFLHHMNEFSFFFKEDREWESELKYCWSYCLSTCHKICSILIWNSLI
jgi:hypothetical protein